MQWLINLFKAIFSIFGSGKKTEPPVVNNPTQPPVIPSEPVKEDPEPIIEEPAPAPQPKPFVYRTEWPKPEWTAMTVKALKDLGQDLLKANPKDAKEFCPNFDKHTEEERIQFYAMLISALAKFESNYKADATYQENFKDRNGQFIISRGLLQLSIESSNGYGAGLKKAEELHDPETNIRTGVRILNRWIPRDGCIVDLKSGKNLGAGRYWSPFRKADRIASIQAKTKLVCK